jgi:hypothetical protein
MSSLCTFLRENQYVLHNDVYGRLVTLLEKARLCRALEAVRLRHGHVLYDNVFPFLGPLLGRIPAASLEKTYQPYSRFLGDEARIPNLPVSDGRVYGYYTMVKLLQDMQSTLSRSWMHHASHIFSHCQHAREDFKRLQELSGYCPDNDPLFCRRHVEDTFACLRAGIPFS